MGFLVHDLKIRMNANAKPLTVISCDNLPGNRNALQKLVQEFFEIAGIDLSNYLDKRISFPNTICDRIVPAIGKALRKEVY